ncbi:glycosyltransferase family 8 protein [Novosphingobium malaysiense]|uniref:Glycosyl transferase n=1 Tax=Novosphingobium malaysiense TaxID=1348853 RepID=A0A0B1ZQK3_9SPHN|nr:glycosyltransferase [Novosphingobium malaysiense]KHK92876.1 hypothetical protein LK12_00195 [Novosphingobium malaysiense]
MSSTDRETAIFLTTDRGYLIPTLVAVSQIIADPEVRRRADVIVFLVDFMETESVEIAREFSSWAVTFRNFSSAAYALPHDATYNPTHVPQSALARLAVGREIPEKYRKVVYIDGDVQIVDSIVPLIEAEPVKGNILAACDHAYINWSEQGGYAQSIRDYLMALNIHNPKDYFNSGVLAASRDDWIEISDRALAYMRSNSHLCRFHDQSALNAVCVGKREPLSPRFNFVSWYGRLSWFDRVKPSIIHFTGGEKPWNARPGTLPGRFTGTYQALVDEFPFLERYWSKMNRKPARGGLEVGWLLPWRRLIRKQKVGRYLQTTNFTV